MEYAMHQLESGLRIVTVPIQEKRSATILILIKVGSRNENKGNNGVAHFIEHMMFKGTQKRPTPIEISEEIDQLGADYNAFTSKEYTGFYIKCSSEYVSQAIDILCDMLSNSAFDVNELTKEKSVIIEEINMYNDTPMRQVGNIYEEICFGGHPLSYDTAGSKKNLSEMTREALVDFKNQHYSMTNTVFILAGDIDVQSSVTEIGKKLQLPSTETPAHLPYIDTQRSPRVKVVKKSSDQAHFCLGYPSIPIGSQMRYAMSLFNIVVGGNMSSRLFVELRERLGLCYYISSDNDAYLDTGTWVIQAGVDVSRLNEAIAACLHELKKIKEHKISPSELDKAKRYLKGRLALGLEDSKGIANLYGINLLLEGRIRTPEEILMSIESVNVSELHKISEDILCSHMITIAVLGPYDAEAKTQEISDIVRSIEI